jgi:2-dehydro-3-deoxygluconokinase
VLDIKSKTTYRWDLVALGEVILRFDPGDERIRDTRHFTVWEGGGEYNVARNLASCFRLETAVATSLADNEIGRLVENLIIRSGVDERLILWRETDGMSKKARNGTYFWERGFGLRPSIGCSDRANTAVSQIKPGEIDWKKVFGGDGVRWFHTGGIFAGLSESTAAVAYEAIVAAREAGCPISYDLNFRGSLWADRGGREAANRLNRRMIEYADVVFGILDFEADHENFEQHKFEIAARKMFAEHKDLKLIATPLRTTRHASLHDLSSVAFDGNAAYRGPNFNDVAILDRVGSGDAFAAGFIFELISENGVGAALATGTAAAALAMTSPGDHLSSTIDEVRMLAERSDRTSTHR